MVTAGMPVFSCIAFADSGEFVVIITSGDKTTIASSFGVPFLPIIGSFENMLLYA